VGLINTLVRVFTLAKGISEISRIALAGNASDCIHAQIVWQWANNWRLFIALIDIETLEINWPASYSIKSGVTDATHDTTW